jgi:hypothetical protein
MLLLPFALKAREAGLQAGRFPFIARSCQQQPLEMRRSAALEAETNKRNNKKQMKKITITRQKSSSCKKKKKKKKKLGRRRITRGRRMCTRLCVSLVGWRLHCLKLL